MPAHGSRRPHPPPPPLPLPRLTPRATARTTGLALLAALALALAPPSDARIQITGSVEAEGEGSAFWIQRTDPVSGRQGFILVLALQEGGTLQAVEFGFLGGERPAAGSHRVLSIDDLPEPDEMETTALEGVLASFLRGGWGSWAEVSAMVSDPEMDFEAFQARTTGMGTGTSGSVEVAGWSGDRMDGRVSAAMVLLTDDGRELPFQVTATFQAGPGPME